MWSLISRGLCFPSPPGLNCFTPWVMAAPLRATNRETAGSRPLGAPRSHQPAGVRAGGQGMLTYIDCLPHNQGLSFNFANIPQKIPATRGPLKCPLFVWPWLRAIHCNAHHSGPQFDFTLAMIHGALSLRGGGAVPHYSSFWWECVFSCDTRNPVIEEALLWRRCVCCGLDFGVAYSVFPCGITR